MEVKQAFFDRITDIVHFTGASKRTKTNPNTPTATPVDSGNELDSSDESDSGRSDIVF